MSKLKWGIAGVVTLFVVLAFGLFPYLAKQILIKNKYIPAREIVLDTKLEAEVLFNDEMDTTVFTDRVLQEIALAEEKIDIAMYSMDSKPIRDALLEAMDRGVRVNFVSDVTKKTKHTELFKEADLEFFYLDLPENPTGEMDPHMHNKFMIVDSDLPRAIILTGAWNWTVAQELIDPTYLFITRNSEIISAYEQEFQRLLSGVHSTKKFQDPAYKPFARRIFFQDSDLELWFSPGIGSNSIQKRMIDLVDEATTSIDIMIWEITDQRLVNHLLKAAQRGVRITMIVDDFSAASEESIITYLTERLASLKLDNFDLLDDSSRLVKMPELSDLNSFLHHHTMIIDNRQVLFGTNNWSKNGAYVNDENTMISDDKSVVGAFIRSFEFQKNDLQ